ncbi:MAG: hypothetical protein KDE20_13870, partial [Caldilineaceae bacterium]|nr:hypothetical protein [Caldilineaceae bacterium]
LDVGLYYYPELPLAIDAVRQIAAGIATAGNLTVTDFYEWGAWVNGGAWIHTAAGKVDFLYRNLAQVSRTIAEAQQGITHHDYGQQPAYGFYSVIYLAETQVCMPLWDPAGVIADLKAQVAAYPPRLKEQVVVDSLWSAEFTLLFARDYAAKGDVYNTVGCLTRVATNLTQALFALNERYFIRDKQVMAALAAFALLPDGYVSRLEAVLANPGATADALRATVADITALWADVVALPGVDYAPRFRV